MHVLFYMRIWFNAETNPQFLHQCLDGSETDFLIYEFGPCLFPRGWLMFVLMFSVINPEVN